MAKKLSRRQQAILDFIRSYLGERGFPPSTREIGEAVGLSSSSTVHAQLRNLEQKGFIRKNPSKPRSITLVEQVPPGPSRVQVLEGLLRRGVEAVEFVRGRGEIEAWAAEVRAALPEVPAA